MSLSAGSLFSGIGGLDLGLERAGMRVVWQSEIEPYACKVLAKYWPTVPNLGDVTKIDWSEVERPDVVAGGFPCQPVSIAGKRADHTADPRWLWPGFARCVGVLRPDHVLVENVPWLLTRGIGDVLGDLAAIGYDAQWDCVRASALGAPHRRVRLFILGTRRGLADTDGQRRQEQRRSGAEFPEAAWLAEPERGGGWAPEPGVGRMAPRFSGRVDRLRCLGNAVVPQVAEYVGRRIMTAEED